MLSRLNPAAFLSYVHSDDDHDRGRITQFRARLEGEVRMHTGSPFKIFQDRNDLEWGQSWQERIENSLNSVIFLIPIITPSYFNSPACRMEFEKFHQREHSLGSNQLILPVYYLSCDQIDDDTHPDDIGGRLRSRQYSDWRNLRFHSLDSADVSRHLAALAADVKSRTSNLAEILSASTATSDTSDGINEADNIQPAAFKGEIVTPEENITSELFRILPIDEPPIADMISAILDSDPTPLDDYKIYTDEFDETIAAESFFSGNISLNILNSLTNLSSSFESDNKRTIHLFEEDLSKWKGDRSISMVFMLDNSGSLRGGPISNLASWIIIISDIFERVGIPIKVVGFTTRAWKGGQSREKWLSNGKPKNPGRLNDIRYIVYKDFGESLFSSVQNFGVMLIEGTLKENIDGEALYFAHSEIIKQESDTKIIAMFSDGAPVDDSTLSVNRERFLEDHLIESIQFIRNTNVDLMAIGIDHDVRRYYGELGMKSKTENIGLTFFSLFRRLFSVQRRSRRK